MLRVLLCFALTVVAAAGEATLIYAVRYKSGRPDLWHVKYSWHFENIKEVRISGYGIAAFAGEIDHYTRLSAITFRDPQTGKELASLPIRETGLVQSPTDIEIPPEHDYPAACAGGEFKVDAALLASNSQRIMAGMFGRIDRWEREDRVYCASEWRPLSGLPDNLRGEMSALLSYSAIRPKGPVAGCLRYVVRERRSHSGAWRAATSNEVKAASASLAAQAVKDLTAETARK